MMTMAVLPLLDRVGNALVAFRFADESEREIVDDRILLPLSLIVVTLADTVWCLTASACSGNFPWNA
jgi:hypothetical protein